MELRYNGKTDNLFERDMTTFKATGKIKRPEFTMISTWSLTEKLDGMSTMLTWDDAELNFHGRSASSNFSKGRIEFFEQLMDRVRPAFSANFPDTDVHVYGELIGPGLQGNPHGIESLEFRVFDVKIGNYFLSWDNVTNVSNKIGLQTVPFLGLYNDLDRVVDGVYKEFVSQMPNKDYFEGVIARTDPYLFTNRHEKVYFKCKRCDLV